MDLNKMIKAKNETDKKVQDELKNFGGQQKNVELLIGNRGKF